MASQQKSTEMKRAKSGRWFVRSAKAIGLGAVVLPDVIQLAVAQSYRVTDSGAGHLRLASLREGA